MAHEVENVLCELAVVGTVMCIVPSVGEPSGEALVLGFGTHALTSQNGSSSVEGVWQRCVVPPAVGRWSGGVRRAQLREWADTEGE